MAISNAIEMGNEHDSGPLRKVVQYKSEAGWEQLWLQRNVYENVNALWYVADDDGYQMAKA